ncbi:MAG: hypothetical protein KTR25_09020 [Myxococcales bacterium]|nr:hypothetical protein [Myxococcales bacterium]
MSVVVGIIAAAFASLLCAALGGHILGGRSYRQSPNRASNQNDNPNSTSLLQAIHKFCHEGRSALPALLETMQAYGSFLAVVVSDQAGLVVASSGPVPFCQRIAVEAAVMGSSTHQGSQWLSLYCTLPNGDWIFHRYFFIGHIRMCVSVAGYRSCAATKELEQAIDHVVKLVYPRSLTPPQQKVLSAPKTPNANNQ